MNRCIVSLIFLIVFLPTYGMAYQEKENIHKLEEMVVTSTNKKKAIDTPASLSIITGTELEEMGAKNVIEALGKIPGVVDSSAKRGTVVIRGNKSAMAGGPVILIDGIPQKIGDSRYSEFDFIPVTQIERIEVLRSAGIAYGPGAARGVINIITKKSKQEGIHGTVSTSYGSWNTHDENASLYGRQKEYDYLLNIGSFHTDGYEQEDENRLSILGKLGYNLSDQTRIGILVNHMDYDINTAYGFRKYQWQLDNYRREIHFPKSATDADLIWNTEKEQENSMLALEFSHQDQNKFINSTLSWTGYDEMDKSLAYFYDKPANVYHNDSEQDAYTASISGGYHFNFGTTSYTPSIGLTYESVDNDVRRIYPFNPKKNTDEYNFDIQEKTYGISWDNDFLFQEKWGLKIGGRLDRTEIKLQDKVPNVVDENQNMFSYFVAPSYHLMDNANLYVSAGRNYWFPTPRYYAWAVEDGGTFNPPENLKPEEVMTYEIGYKHMLNKSFNMNATLYFSEYKDKFGSVYEGTTSRGRGNIGDAEAKGIELEADGRLCSFFGYRLAGTYQDIEWTSGTVSSKLHPSNVTDKHADITGKQIYWVPEFSGLMGLDFFPMKGLKLNVDINYMGDRYVDYLNRIKYPAKTTFDAGVSYSWNQWKLWLLGKNIFNEPLEYVSNTSGTLTGVNGDPKNAYYVQDGAYFELGISYSF
jgi:iron complex outermembrane receptor protein